MAERHMTSATVVFTASVSELLKYFISEKKAQDHLQRVTIDSKHITTVNETG